MKKQNNKIVQQLLKSSYTPLCFSFLEYLDISSHVSIKPEKNIFYQDDRYYNEEFYKAIIKL